MNTIERRLLDLDLTLPAPVKKPEGVHIPFSPVRVLGNRLLFSGHPRHDAQGNITGPYGTLGADLNTQDGKAAAQSIALCVLANIKAEIGDLSRIQSWARVFGMVASTPAYTEQHLVLNGFSDTILEIFGPEVGRHARSAMGAASLPLGFAIEVEGEVIIDV